jgi:transposase InsO family protein
MISQLPEQYTVERACTALMVSPSGYYAWKERQTQPPSPRMQRDQELTARIHTVYRQSRCTYGSPRIHAQLRQEGVRCSKHKVAAVMRKEVIRSLRGRRRRPQTTDSNHSLPVAKNLLDRDFTATDPNQKWVADVTYIPAQHGWLYLAVVIDLFSRKVVGWAMAARFDSRLVCAALNDALSTRPAPQLHHSDRGVQYASIDYREVLTEHKIQSSMSRIGDCYDNAVVESFFATLKQEALHNLRFVSLEDAELTLFGFIDGYYNCTRLHSYLDYSSPNDFERNYFQAQFFA